MLIPNKIQKGEIRLKKRYIVLVLLLLMIGIRIIRLYPSYSSTIEANWGIALPIKAVLTEEYVKETEDSFRGEGIRYHVFIYQYEDYIELMFAWSGSKYPTNYYSSTQEAAEAWLDEISVPEDKRPNYSKCYSWHKSQADKSEIIFFWNSELNELYIIENLI